ncbi:MULTISPECIES: AtpZ/AtpI family protein [unclassified Saccharibacter]|uniref:AtpZ/AtpI family protein n=1 Tax=unclassified Saccharibacter TaxID=2648722 RepID=UPI00351B04C0
MDHLSSKEERRFEERLSQAESRRVPQTKARRSFMGGGENSSFGMALRIGSDMIAGIAIGVGIGYGLDRWTGHLPLFLIVFTLLGFCAGMRNVWRVVNAPIPDVGAKKDGRSQRGQRIND